MCSFPDCGRRLRQTGLCDGHLYQRRRGKELSPLRPRRKSGLSPLEAVEALRQQFVQEDGSGCWLWTAATNAWGYGMVGWEGAMRASHRVFYEVLVEPIPVGAVVHHRCARRLCVRPEHLQMTTSAANSAEMFERTAYLRRIADLEAALSALDPDHPLL